MVAPANWRDRYLSYLRHFEVPFEVRSGWLKQSAGRGNWIDGAPVGLTQHHFVSSKFPPDSQWVRMLEEGYQGSPAPYVVNEFLGEDAAMLYLISSYPTGHPGRGSRTVLDRILSGKAPLGDAADLGYANDLPQDEAELRYYGIEVDNPGDGTPLTPRQYQILVARNAALCLALNLSSNCVHQHREHTNRKIDINKNALNADTLRNAVSTKMRTAGGPIVIPPKPQPKVDDTMYLLKSDDDHPVYLVGAGSWRHINPTEKASLERNKLVGPVRTVSRRELVAISQAVMGGVKDAKGKPYVKPDSTPAAPAQRTHKVKNGETLSSIAAKYPPITWQQIAAANKLSDPDSIVPDQVLIIPK